MISSHFLHFCLLVYPSLTVLLLVRVLPCLTKCQFHYLIVKSNDSWRQVSWPGFLCIHSSCVPYKRYEAIFSSNCFLSSPTITIHVSQLYSRMGHRLVTLWGWTWELILLSHTFQSCQCCCSDLYSDFCCGGTILR